MKTFRLVSILAILLFFSGCVEYIDNISKSMQDARNKEALAQTEDLEMVKLFIDKLPTSKVSQNQIFMDYKLDLGKQTTNVNNWVYNPIGYFEKNMNEETKVFTFWVNAVKNRGGIIKKYNGNVAKEINNFVYLNSLQPYEHYYSSLAPAYIEYDKSGNMISSYVRRLKTEDLSAVSIVNVEGKHLYSAYSYDIVVLRTYLKKLQMSVSKKFFEENLLDENIITKESSNPIPANNENVQKVDIEKMMIDKFNAQNGTNVTNMAELQQYLSKQAK